MTSCIQFNEQHLSLRTGKILRMMRRSRSMTQEHLSQLLKEKFGSPYCRSHISRLERGTAKQGAEFIYMACEIYGFHTVTFAMCMVSDDTQWWRLMLGLNAGMTMEATFSKLFARFGVRLYDLNENDIRLARELVTTTFETALSPAKS